MGLMVKNGKLLAHYFGGRLALTEDPDVCDCDCGPPEDCCGRLAGSLPYHKFSLTVNGYTWDHNGTFELVYAGPIEGGCTWNDEQYWTLFYYETGRAVLRFYKLDIFGGPPIEYYWELDPVTCDELLGTIYWGEDTVPPGTGSTSTTHIPVAPGGDA